ncbi:MAG: DMT family transporter [Xylophilus ampelinus]
MPPPRKNHLDGTAVALLLACCLFWGFQQVMVKATAAQVPPVLQAALRFGLAAPLLAAWCAARGIAPLRRDGSLGAGLLVGLLFAAEFACLHAGLQHTTAARLTLFLYTAPFWLALLLPRFVPGERLRGGQWAGLAASFAGVGLALADRGSAPADSVAGDLLGIAAGLLWALTTVGIRATAVGRLPPERQLFYQVVTAAPVCAGLSWLLGEDWTAGFGAWAWASIGLQAAVGAFASYLAWVWMLARYPATRLSAFTFLTPLFALLVGALWLREPVTPALAGALALVAAGIVLVNRRPARAGA